MPRVKADNARKRCAHACDNCKRRKERCDSEQPCSICVKRHVECRFSDIPASEIRKASSETKQLRLAPDVDPSGAGDAIDCALNPQHSERIAHRRASIKKDLDLSEAPVPRSARLLQDSRGSFIYFGDSASLSFLQNVRRVTSSILGACPFTTDRLRHSVLEDDPDGAAHSSQSPPGATHAAHRGGMIPHAAQRNADMLTSLPTAPLPAFKHAELLANEYLTASSGRLNLFDTADLMQSLASWTTDPQNHCSGIHEALLNLVMSIGAQSSQDLDDNAAAEDYFRVGRRQALLLFTEEPSLETVQSHVLIASYLLSGCRRNAAFMNLGIAIRASHALGLHRADVQTLFTPQEKLQRKRAWNSVRILDLFSSASMGRPPATSDFGTDYLYESVIKQQTLTDPDKYTLANQKLCNILEMILMKVYKNRSVSTQVADEISKEYRDWAAKLPPLPLSLDNEPTDPRCVTAARKLATVHLLGAYHWSIILLTRPFLVFNVSLRRRRKNDQNAAALRASVSSSSVSTLADACIDSAVKTVDIMDDLVEQPRFPKRLPFVLNSTFNSALAIGVAFFGDYDRSFPLAEGLEKALKVLQVLSPHDPSADRYFNIVSLLADAVREFVRKRDRSSMKQHSQRISDMFGQVATGVNGGGTGSPLNYPQSSANLNPASVSGSSNQGTPSSGPMPLDSTGTAHGSSGAEDVNPYLPTPGTEATHPTLTTTGLLLSMNALDPNTEFNPETFFSNMSVGDYPFDPLNLGGPADEETMIQNHMNLFNPLESGEFFER